MSDEENAEGENGPGNGSSEEDAPAPPPVPARPVGAYGVAPVDAKGVAIREEVASASGAPEKGDSEGKAKKVRAGFVDPSDERAVNIFFGVLPGVEAPPKDQTELQDAIGQVLTTVRKLYINSEGEVQEPFRLNYVRLYRLAQLGLTGNAMPEVAKTALERVIDDLVQTEAPRVKNQHLKRLAESVAFVAAWFFAFYVLIAFLDIGPVWEALSIDPEAAGSFMMLWVGTSVGVWLSYAIRKSDFKLRDLTVVDSDFLEPTTRVIFACLLATVIGMLLMLNFIDVTVGTVSISDFSSKPTIALVLGVVLGINEMMLPSSVAKRTKDIWEKIQ